MRKKKEKEEEEEEERKDKKGELKQKMNSEKEERKGRRGRSRFPKFLFPFHFGPKCYLQVTAIVQITLCTLYPLHTSYSGID